MAFSTIPKVRRDGTITLKDGGSASLEIQYEEGNLTFEITKADQTVIRDRSSIVTVRKGDDMLWGSDARRAGNTIIRIN